MDDREGPKSLPDDANVEELLYSKLEDDGKELIDVLDNLKQTMEVVVEMGDDPIIAYGNLMNYLASDEVGYPKLFRLLCAALWELA